MPSGGARAGAGGPQDPNALDISRRKVHDLIALSPEPRAEPAPSWPLGDQSEVETDMWAAYWRKPQAQYWLDFHMVEVVALYVRQFCEAATPKNSAENRKAAQSFLSLLGLTGPALKAAGYTIEALPDQAAKPKPVRRSSARDRLTVVDGGAGA